MKRYTSEVLDAEDGSGDAVLQLLPEMCAEEDWREGDTIKLEVVEDTLILRNLSKVERENLQKQIP